MSAPDADAVARFRKSILYGAVIVGFAVIALIIVVLRLLPADALVGMIGRTPDPLLLLFLTIILSSVWFGGAVAAAISDPSQALFEARTLSGAARELLRGLVPLATAIMACAMLLEFETAQLTYIVAIVYTWWVRKDALAA